MEENKVVLKEPQPSAYVLKKRFEDSILYNIENSNLHLIIVETVMEKLTNQIKAINEAELEKDQKRFDKEMQDYYDAQQQEQGGNE